MEIVAAIRKQLQHATRLTEKTGGGILLVAEGVYGMIGDLAIVDQMIELKKEFDFRILLDDAHGFGTMGKTGAGTGEHLGIQDKIDINARWVFHYRNGLWPNWPNNKFKA